MQEIAQDILGILTGFFSVERLIQVVVILTVAIVVQLFSKTIIQQIVRQTVRPSRFPLKSDEKQREDTLIAIIYTTTKVTLWVIVVLMILGTFEVSVGPLLAGAGIAGVALGFGAQTIVRDFLSGLFILIENQYRIGDVVELNQEISGTVEAVTLRMTTLRDLEGRVHYVPNGQIKTASNMTMEYANVELDIGVAYDSDLDHVEAVINRAGETFYEDEEWKGPAQEPFQVLRVDRFADSAIIIRIMCKTLPAEQWRVRGEILKRIKRAFDEAGIEIPYPNVTVHKKS